MMKIRPLAYPAGLCLLLLIACSNPKPSLSGRLRGPAGIAQFKGCPQSNPACNRTEEGHHLLLLSNAQSDDVRIFDAEIRTFFEAINPLFPLTIPVGQHPRGIGVDPYGEWAMVANQLSEDLSLVNLAPNRMVEVDTDGDPSTVAASLGCPEHPNQLTDPTNDRCLAGVSRAPLSEDEAMLLPDQVAIPAGDSSAEDGIVWPREEPLPVWVSLPAAGRVALLNFRYPSASNPVLLTYVASIDLGGRPSGLAVSADGSTLYVADEDSDSIAVVDTQLWEVSRVLVDGPTRRVFLTPDESVLYAVRLDDNRIALVDTATLERRPAYTPEDPRAQDPERDGLDILLPGIPREVVFANGQLASTEGFEGITVPYPWRYIPKSCDDPAIEQLGPPTTALAFVSDLNGNVYILDAERHGPIDLRPTVGPSVGPAGFVVDKDNVIGVDFLSRCSDTTSAESDFLARCPYPYFAYMHESILVDEEEIKNDDDQVIDVIVHDEMTNGVRTFPGKTRTEGWVLTWEGVLPNTGTSTSGHFVGGRLEDDRPGLDFRDLGIVVRDANSDTLEVLSDQALAPDGSGDVLPACLDDNGNKRKTFRITGIDEVGGGYIVINPAGVDLGLCWPGAVRYQIRASKSWTVVGTKSGIQKRLTEDMMLPWDQGPPEGDFTEHPSLYDNGYIALTMVAPGPTEDDDGNLVPTEIPRGAAWGFSTESGYGYAYFAPSVRVGMAGPLVAVDLDDGGEQSREDTFCDLVTGPAIDRIYLVFEASNALMEFFPGALDSNNFLLYQ